MPSLCSYYASATAATSTSDLIPHRAEAGYVGAHYPAGADKTRSDKLPFGALPHSVVRSLDRRVPMTHPTSGFIGTRAMPEGRHRLGSNYLKRFIPLTVRTDKGIDRFLALVRQRVANSRLNKLRHSLPLLDGRDFRPPVHLNIKR